MNLFLRLVPFAWALILCRAKRGSARYRVKFTT